MPNQQLKLNGIPIPPPPPKPSPPTLQEIVIDFFDGAGPRAMQLHLQELTQLAVSTKTFKHLNGGVREDILLRHHTLLNFIADIGIYWEQNLRG